MKMDQQNRKQLVKQAADRINEMAEYDDEDDYVNDDDSDEEEYDAENMTP